MDLCTLKRTLNNLKKKCDDLVKYAQEYEESESAFAEINIKSKNCHCLQQKVEKLRKQYYELPETLDISKEDEALYDLEEQLETLEVRFNVILDYLTSKREKTIKDNSENECPKSTRLKLPKIPLPIFDGKYEEWNNFEKQFKSLITDSDDITDNEKLYYLRSSLTGVAKEVETEEDTFESLFNALKERFQNKKLIVNAHVNTIINYEKIQYASAKDIRCLLDSTRKNLRALKVLEFDRNKLTDVILLNILLPKLDRESRKIFESSLETSEVPKLDSFLDFLEKRSMVLESLRGDQGVKVAKNVALPPWKCKSFLANSRSLPQPQEERKCQLCEREHQLVKCNTFKQLDATGRYAILRAHKLCLACMKESHVAAQCRLKNPCNKCGGKHHTMLHRPFKPAGVKKDKENDPRSTSPETEENAAEVLCSNAFSRNQMVTTKKSNLLLTAMVFVEGYDGQRKKIRAVLDTASQVNLMSADCANILKLRKEKANVPVSGINGTVRTIKSKLSATISNEENSFKEEMEFLVVSNITNRTPSTTLDIENLELPPNIKLADSEFFKPSKIQLLLGIDPFFKILKCNKIKIDDSLILQDTVFGYVISGKLPSAQPLNRCLLTSELGNLVEKVEKFWKLESVEEIPNRKSEDELFCETHFLSTHRRDSSGRYIVDVPLKSDPKILGESKEFIWQHIRSEENPADLVSRGISGEKILECSLWWNGPTALQQESLPSSDIPYLADDEYIKELKKNCELTMTVNTETELVDTLLERTNDFLKLIRTLSFIFRFIENSRNPLYKSVGPLESRELSRAQNHILRHVQVREFKSEIKCLSKGESIPVNSKLKGLNPYLDENSLLRVGGRLINADLHFDQIHPVVIPKDSKITKMIFEYFHKKNFHAGPQALLYSVREQFWPIRGRDVARKVVKNCIICFKNNPKICTQVMGNLPSERVNPTSPFNITGVDFAGPFHIKASTKRRGNLIKVYLAVFICFVTKAMHLEVVSDLSAAAFIASLKRFFARRGKSAKLFSDNATNFVGANTELRKLHELVRTPDEELGNYLSSEQITWKFIPARSPNFGGLWESGVKTIKYYLKRTVANANLTYEEFLTIVVQIEGIVNSRPISPLSSDPNDFRALTPGHFLIGRPLNALPEPELLGIKENRLSRWQLTTKIVQNIWHRWQKDYLNNLQNRTKWFFQKDNVSRDDLVLIKDDNLPPCKWGLGRITEIIKGTDGKVRVAIVKTPTGIIKRGVTKLCVLPMNE